MEVTEKFLHKTESDLENSEQDPNHITIKLFKDYKICINKPLIPLKLALFCYYGAGSFMPSFMTIIYKQRGVTLAELSSMTIVAPIIQFIGSAISGIIADKIGTSKPVFVTNLLFVLTAVSIILFLPKIEHGSYSMHAIDLFCRGQQLDRLVAQTNCSLQGNKFEIQNCQANCSENVFEDCDNLTSLCSIIDGNNIDHTSIYVKVEQPSHSKTSNKCICNNTAIEDGSSSSSRCRSDHKLNCSVSCELSLHADICKYEGFNCLMIIYSVVFVSFLTTFSNCYRCMDTTTMFLVKEHKSNFGHERFFAISGNVIISLIAGYVVETTTPLGVEKNYSAALYLFLSMNCFLLVILYKLPVSIIPPGKRMWKKSLSLMKNLDVIVFFLVILVLGTSWNFTKFFLFWYLEEMHASSLLIGLISSVSALYGLPFLLTSKWWMKKIGSKRLIVLAFLAYSFHLFGYSLLQNPWFSLALEAIGAIKYYLLWVAVVEHSHEIAPEGLTCTVITVSGAIHYSIGKTTSGLTGGLIMNEFGGKAAFRFNAVLCLCFAVFYALFIRIRYNHSLKNKLEHADVC